MSEMNPADVPVEFVEAATNGWVLNHGPDGWDSAVCAMLAAVLPLHRKQIADALERHAESIGWYEGGGVWAEALDVIQRGDDRA